MSKEKDQEQALVKEESKNIAIDLALDLSQFEGSETAVTGLEAVDQTDIKLPAIRIIQMLSEEATKNNVPPGSFYNTVTKEHSDSLECVLLTLGKSRVMWPSVFKRGDKPLCRSFDGKTKTEGIGDGVCQKCQYSQWIDGEKPKCTQGYVWMAVDKTGQPFRLNAKGASVGPTKDFLTAVSQKLNSGGKKIGIFALKIKLTLDKISDEKGVYFVLNYKVIGTIDPKVYKELEGLSLSLQELFLKAIDKDNSYIDADFAEYPQDSSAPANAPEAEKKGVLF